MCRLTKQKSNKAKFVEFISPGKRVILENGINLNPNMFTLGIIQIIVKALLNRKFYAS